MKRFVGILFFSLFPGISSMAEGLTQTQIHATMGIVTNFILEDTIFFRGYVYRPIVSPYTGRVWLDRNLGAKRVCRSYNDTACYGKYYQWGRNADGHEDKNSPTTNVQSIDVNDVGHGYYITENGTYDWDWAKAVDSNGSIRSANWLKSDGSSVCPKGFRVPTISELKAELLDPGSAEIQNKFDAFGTFLKLPSTGTRSNLNGNMVGVGSLGSVWSATPGGAFSMVLGYSDSQARAYDVTGRAQGRPVRCIKTILCTTLLECLDLDLFF